MKLITKLLVCLGIAALGTLAVPPAGAQPVPGPRHVDVVGNGEVPVAPDLAVVTLGVESWAANLLAARSDNAGRMAKLLAVPPKYGVDPKDVGTDFAAIEPQYDSGSQGPVRAFSGYRVTNLVTVRLRDLSVVGPFVTEALNSGANRLDGVKFVVEDPADAQARARKRAVDDAERKAVELALELGQDLGKPLAVSENPGGAYPVPRFKALASEAGPAPGESFAPGQVVVSVQVNVEYELIDK